MFDLDAYRRERDFYAGRVLGSDDPLLREIVDFAKAEGYTFPLRSRLIAPIFARPGLFRVAKRSKEAIERPRRVLEGVQQPG